MKRDFEKYKPNLGTIAVIGTGDLGEHVVWTAVAHNATGILATGNSRINEVIQLVSEVGEYLPAVVLRISDLRDPHVVEQDIAEAEEKIGHIEKYVITVATQPSTPFLDQTPEEFEHVHRVNVVGPFFFARAVLERSKKTGKPIHVIFVSSDNSLVTEFDPNTPHYDASKASLNHLVQSLAFHYAPEGSQVNAVLPGWIKVPSQKDVEGIDAIYRSIAMGRPATPEEVAIGIVHLAKEPHVTGTLRIIANGGGTNRAHLRT